MTRLLRKREVADALGISVSTVERLIGDGRLQALKLSKGRSGRVRVPESAVDEFVAKKMRDTGSARRLSSASKARIDREQDAWRAAVGWKPCLSGPDPAARSR